MSSRHEEKAARRAEREAQEAEAAKAAGRTKRMQMALGAFLVIAILGGSAAALLSGGGSGGGSGKVQKGAVDKKAAIPAVQETDLTKAAALAKCTLSNPKIEGSTHVTGTVVYHTNPPSSGNHNQTPAEDGIYAPGNEPAKENFVHSLEHGRIEIEYAKGSTPTLVNQMETVGSEELNGSAAYHVLVFENNTNMPYQVAAVAWGHILGCKTMNPRVFDAIRAFRKTYTDKAPELIP
ncbi:DUF3105 domain-containing protein [Paraconexibacter antarcticus]|uniref:DUF3105 domain-containing protein n=1 Tax=Paraconexibacter antarcticus TaxID=2949664 RepID=A0ABY5DTW6_9ACTN|nr:DUF3105 domain-containing protein [Paraconexibacter antarcticus]UTI64723.1 DUF3105 domain-containing protein [Paraconexibacter antarcticus]